MQQECDEKAAHKVAYTVVHMVAYKRPQARLLDVYVNVN